MSSPNTWITPAGHQALLTELDTLWREERPKVTEEVRIAAAHGDRSENAEYKYGKQRLREIDRRLRFLKRRIDSVKVLRAPADPDGRVHFGCWVRLRELESEQCHSYQIVGTDEVHPDAGKISVLSPIGRALMGREIDEDISVKTPKGIVEFCIEEVQAQAFEPPQSGRP